MEQLTTYVEQWSTTQLPIETGKYTISPGGGRRITAIPCPYCELNMFEAVNGELHRIAVIIQEFPDRVVYAGDRIPDSHVGLICLGCHVAFTMPRRMVEPSE